MAVLAHTSNDLGELINSVLFLSLEMYVYMWFQAQTRTQTYDIRSSGAHRLFEKSIG